MSAIQRGDIYRVFNAGASRDNRFSRLGVVVSSDYLNQRSPVVEVVFMVSKPWDGMGYHYVIESAGAEKMVLCEQINTVSKDRLGECIGMCTPEEMAAVNICIMAGLGLNPEEVFAEEEQAPEIERDDEVDEYDAEDIEAAIEALQDEVVAEFMAAAIRAERAEAREELMRELYAELMEAVKA